MIKNILVAVDGSSHSLKAVEFAANIAGACDATLHILTVIKRQQVPKIPDDLRRYIELEGIEGADMQALKLLSTDLLKYAEGVAREHGATKIDTSVDTGPVARTVVAVAERMKVDMIAIGSRGLGNIEATLRGGVSHRVELLAQCPVLVVK